MSAIPAIVVRGHRVASGAGGDPRFPEGTLRLQFPVFAALGLKLDGFHPGTVNVSIDPWRYRIVRPRLTLRGVKWHPAMPAEDFSFFDVRVCLRAGAGGTAAGLIYLPHQETKPEHFQPPDVLELLLPYLADLAYGSELRLEAPPEQMLFDRVTRSAESSRGTES